MAKKKPDSLAKMIGDAIAHLPEAAEAFQKLAAAPPADRGDLLKKLHAVEADADERYLKALRKTAGTFITPYDREDIFVIVELADDFIDQLDHVGILFVAYNVGDLPNAFGGMTQSLRSATEHLAEAVGLLKKQEKLEKHLFAINGHIGAFDAQYRSLLIETLGTDASPNADAMRLWSLANGLEHAAERLTDLTRALGIAAIKET